MIPDDVKFHIRARLAQSGNTGLSVAEIYDYLIGEYGVAVATKEQIRSYLEYEAERPCTPIYKQSAGTGYVRYFYHE